MKTAGSLKLRDHVIIRLKERWKILTGAELEEKDILPTLQELIEKSVPEPDSLAVIQRKERHTEGDRYMISGPWRLVWEDDELATVELRNLGTFTKPKIYLGEAKAAFCLKITEADYWTLLGKGESEFLISLSKPEINAIIRFLRLAGIDIEYKRFGTETKKQVAIFMLLPKELRKFEIQESQPRNIIMSFPSMKRTFHIFGITEEACREILEFLNSQVAEAVAN